VCQQSCGIGDPLAAHKIGLDPKPLEHVIDCRPAAMHHNRVQVTLLHQHDVAGEIGKGRIIPHGMAAKFDDDRGPIIALQIRKRARQRLGSGEHVGIWCLSAGHAAGV